MKKTYCLLLLLIISCSKQNEVIELNSPYLGQTPPDMIPQIFAPGIISSSSNDMDITFTPDGNEIFFSRSGPDWFSAILYLKKESDKWRGPNIAPFPNVHSIIYPFVNPNGKILYFDSNADIYYSKKEENSWSSPIRLGPNINTSQREGFVSASLNGNLYFSANHSNTKGGMDIYMSENIDGEYGKVFHLSDSINSEYNEFHACISPGEEYIVFDSQRPNGLGGNDLYISFRKKDGTWTKAKNLGEPINTEMSDMRPYITPDGKYLFFSSTRSLLKQSDKDINLTYEEFMRKIEGPGNGSQDIYWVNTKVIEQFKPKELE